MKTKKFSSSFSFALLSIMVILNMTMTQFLLTLPVQAEEFSSEQIVAEENPVAPPPEETISTETTTEPIINEVTEPVITEASDSTTDTETTIEVITPEISTETTVLDTSAEQTPEVIVQPEEKITSEISTSNEPVVAESNPILTPVLSTDKADYLVGEIATIFGSFFQSLQNLVLKIFGSGPDNNDYTETTQNITADEQGSFNTTYQLDNIYRPLYTVAANSTEGVELARTTFTDSKPTEPKPPSAGIDVYSQCSNDDGDGYGGNPGTCNWTNGNLQKNNSTYFEGDATVQRLAIQDLATGEHTITISYGTTKGGKHAYDFITSDKFSENWITDADFCSSPITNFANCNTSNIDYSYLIPTDSNAAGHDTHVNPNRYFTIRNGLWVNGGIVSGPTLVSGNYSGDSETTIQLKFAVDPNTCINSYEVQGFKVCEVLITFGAHISDFNDWGEPTANSISGSPYHVAVTELDGTSVGQRDNQMQAGTIAVPQTGHIIVDKITNPAGDSQSFSFTTTGTSYTGFSLTDTAIPNDQELNAGTYSVAETVPTGWDLTSATCDDGSPVNAIDLSAGETVTCTFTNTKRGHIIVDKVTTGGDATFSFDASGGTDPTYTDFTLTGAQTPNDQELKPGSYSVVETVPTGWDLSSVSCISSIQDTEVNTALELDAGETITCTFNDTKRGKIIIEKQTLPDGDAQSFEFDPSWSTSNFNLTDGNQNDSGWLVPGTYAVSETALAGWDLTSAVCSDGSAVSAIGLAAGETVTCVFTNTKRSSISGMKFEDHNGDSLNNDSDHGLQNWTINLSGVSSASATTDSSGNYSFTNLVPGTYYVCEILKADWTQTAPTSGYSCPSGKGYEITLTAGQNATGKNFGNFEFGYISGYKYNDQNGNGKKDIGELPLQNWTIYLDTNNNGQLDGGETSTLTDAAGHYIFNDLGPGTYHVREVLQTGWSQTDPTSADSSIGGQTDGSYTIIMNSNGAKSGRNFGNQALPLQVTKTANTSLTRTYNWTIDKSVDKDTLNMFKGDSGSVEYTVAVDKTDYTDSARVVAGTITIHNQAAIDATITGVSDTVSGADGATVNCGVTFPYTLAAGQNLSCTYTKSLSDATTRTNTATVTTSGSVGGGSGTASVDFSGATITEINSSINITDTNNQPWGPVSDDASWKYSKTFTCDNDKGKHDNTATITETQQSDSASVTVNCYALEISKNATTSFDRTYNWTIDKTADQTSLTLSPDQAFTVNYSVQVNNSGSVDSNWAVNGTITVHNPAPIAATINSVADLISDVGAITPSCGVTFPYTLAADGNLTCTYTSALPDAATRTNTATATLQNYSYDKDLNATAGGTTDFSGNTSVSFANATKNDIDECLDVSDTYASTLGKVCIGDTLPKIFTYSRQVGPYTLELCGVPQKVDNTATLTTNDTQKQLSDNWTVNVNIACVCSLTQGYWKTHSEYGKAPYDNTWALLPNGADTPFFLSGQSYYDVLWTAPKGGDAYYTLAHQYIAAQLNKLNGAYMKPSVLDAFNQAKTYFETYSPTALNLKGKNADALRKTFINLASILGAFNEGLTNPAGHCDEQINQGTLTGSWLLSVNNGTYLHDMFVTENSSGVLTGTGGYPAGSGPTYPYPYNWTLTGQHTDSTVTMTLTYENGYTATITGTINPTLTTMSGGAGTGGVTNWTAARK